MNSKFKYSVKLKQHTPIIHFQSNQAGATLRATELRPKLDKFLKKYVFDNDKEKYKDFLIKDKEAFDYKVKITSPNSSRIRYKTFIATRDRNNPNIQKGAYFGDFYALKSKFIEIEFFSFKTKLIQIIKENFEEFLILESFGNRKNKGFGNYTLTTTSKEYFEKVLDKYFIKIKKIENKKPLEWVLNEYQLLKSGTNRPYQKSKLMKYFLEKGIYWEKRWIKRVLKENYPNIFNDLKDDYHKDNEFNFNNNENYLFIRCLLGMPNHYEFLLESGRKLSISVSSLNNNIERVPSPIIFKIFENNVYVLLRKNKPIDERIFNQRFEFKANYNNIIYELGELSTPNNFEIEKFLKESL